MVEKITDLEPPAMIMAFLTEIGATKTPHHAGRSLQTHLVATWKILTSWKQSEAVCIGGLCHSLYGTDAFDTACLGPDDRSKVKEVLGWEAEQISYLFGAMRRDAFLADIETCRIENRFSNASEPITETERTALCHILLANELDLVIAKKGADRPDKVIKKVGPVFERIQPYLTQAVKAEFANLSTGN